MRLLQIGDVARELGISVSYVGYLAETGKLKYQRDRVGKGALRLFRWSDVQKFKRQREHTRTAGK